jgi:ectoine hydroxylase-related dioxygenase (phytanoyl-CoA dioxygenase family)
MKALHLSNVTTLREATAHIRQHGYVIIDNVVPDAVMDRIQTEIHPYLEQSPFSEDENVGRQTRRTGALIVRSRTTHQLILHPTILAVAGNILGHATTYQLHLTQVISVYPGATAQPLHQDEVAWDQFPFPDDYNVQCNTLWALSDFTAEMGATRIVPGSHRAGKLKFFNVIESIPAEMSRGSVLIYTGKLYHGAGANLSNRVRQAVNVTYSVGWVRQEENQYLSCPLEIAKTLPDCLLRLMGYQCGSFGLGYVRDFENPMNVIIAPAVKRMTTRQDLWGPEEISASFAP